MRFLSALMGVSFRPKEVREIITSGMIEQLPLMLERDPDNEYDSNAIKVMASVPHDELTGQTQSEFVGFVAKEVAEELAPLLDSGWTADEVKVIGWLSTNKPHLEIEVSLADDNHADEAPDSTYEQG